MFIDFLENFHLSDFPIIIGVPASVEWLRALDGKSPDSLPCHAVEIRLDLLDADPFSPELADALAACPLPILLTARHPREGGAGKLDSTARAAMIRHHLPAAWAIDLELRSLPELSELAAEAKSRGIAVIGSFHDFEKTPDPPFLAEVISRGKSAGVDIVKIAAHLRSPRDLAHLIALFSDPTPAVPLAAMGMGPLGKVSRLALAKCGSVLAYGYLGTANVDGQWSATEFKDRLADL